MSGNWQGLSGAGPLVVSDGVSKDKQVPVSPTNPPVTALKETAAGTSLFVNAVQYLPTKDQSTSGLYGQLFHGQPPNRVLCHNCSECGEADAE